MTLAGDGDLGDLGVDQLGEAANGPSAVNVEEFNAALHKLRSAAANVALAQENADAAINLVEGWVKVGEQALAIAGPLLTKVMSQPAETEDAQRQHARTSGLVQRLAALGLGSQPGPINQLLTMIGG